VYEYEKNNLKDTKYYNLVDNSPAKDPNLGYDILSYSKDGHKKYIEVKTEALNKENDFFISSNELSIAKKVINDGYEYYIYRVHNILRNRKEIFLDIILLSDILDSPSFIIEPCTYRVSSK